MNPGAILSLIGDLYAQVAQLQKENAALREQAAPATSDHPSPQGA